MTTDLQTLVIIKAPLSPSEPAFSRSWRSLNIGDGNTRSSLSTLPSHTVSLYLGSLVSLTSV